MSDSTEFRWHDAVDFDELIEKYPPPPEYFDENGLYFADRDEIRELQLERLKWKVNQAWEIPFYRRRWEQAGVSPDDIKTLDDINKIPIYTVEDIRDSIDRAPPYGDYQGASMHEPDHAPLRFFTSGGTTGAPRPQIYTAREREIMGIQLARSYWMHGLRPGDVVQNAWEFSTHNGAWILDRAFYNWLGVTDVTTSTGVVTPSEQQVKHAVRWDVDSIFAFPSYLIRLAEVAEQEGYDLDEDFDLKTLSTYGPQNERDLVEEKWGVPVYNNYAFHEVCQISFECQERVGMHIMEDMFIIQLVDPETGEEVEPGEQGEIVVTELFKTGAPQVRYNIQDLSVLRTEPCDCGSVTYRLEDFMGRGDNMVKVRGVNVWPEAIGSVLAQHPDTSGEYFVIVDEDTDSLATEMTVLVEHHSDVRDTDQLKTELVELLRSQFGVRIDVSLRETGELADLTEVGQQAKIKRFEDRR